MCPSQAVVRAGASPQGRTCGLRPRPPVHTGSAPLQLSIDSCWVGSFYCPQASFTATIFDAIATESTLFIRQNQLVYYFTGTYSILHQSDHGSGEVMWSGHVARRLWCLRQKIACWSPRGSPEGTHLLLHLGLELSWVGRGVLEGLSKVLNHPALPSGAFSHSLYAGEGPSSGPSQEP